MNRRGLAFLLLAALLTPMTANAAESPPREERIAELQEAIGEASAEEAAALRELSEIRARRSELDASIRALESRINEAGARAATHQAEVDRLAGEIAALQAQITETTNRLVSAETKAEKSAAELYVNESGGVVVRVGVLEADTFQEAYIGTHYLAHVSNVLWGKVHELSDLKVVIEQLEADAETQRAAADAARAAAEAERGELDGLRAQQRAERAEVANEEANERELVEEIRDRRDEFASELAALQASSSAISQMLATRQKNQTRATSFSVVRPVPGAITGGFGPRVHPILGDTRTHNGVDMRAGHGTPIKAGASGTVAFAGVRNGYGNTVIIDHGNQYATLYAHASSLSVSTGQRVSAGQTVALVGATGLATGAHLHFEVRLLGTPVNPVNYM